MKTETRRKHAEEALCKERDRAQEYLDIAGVIIVAIDAAQQVTLINRKGCAILGHEKDEILGSNWFDMFIPERMREAVKSTFAQLMAGDVEPVEFFENPVLNRDGEERLIAWHNTVLRDDADHIIGALSSGEDITERKRAEEALRESEARYKSVYAMFRLMADNMPDLLWAKDMDRRYLFANQAICEKLLLARDTDEPIGKNDMFFANRARQAHPDDPKWHTFGEICVDSDSVVMSSRQPERFDEFGNVQGEFLYLDVYKAPIWDEQGEMVGTVGCGRIVTREKQIEQDLRESEAKMKSIFRAAPIGIGVVSDRVLLDVNDRFCEITGYSKDELVGKNARMVYPTDEDYEYVGKEKYRQIQERGTGTVETRFRHKDGKIIDVLLSSTPLDPTDLSVGVMFTTLDISERKRAEEALRESEERFRAIFETAQDSIFIKDRALRYTQVNPGMERLFGFPAEKLIGRTDKDLFGEEAGTRVSGVDSRVLSGEIVEEEHTKPVKGIPRTFHVIKVPMRDGSGQITGLCGIARDITERKRAEEALERRAAQLALLNDVGKRIASTLEVDEVLDKATYLVHRNFGYHHVGIFVMDRERNGLALRSKAGDFIHLFPADHCLELGQGLVGWVGRHGKTLLANDVDVEPRYVNLYPDAIPTRSELSVAIQAGEKFLGVLDVQSPELNAFDENDVMVMETLADQVAVAIENAELFQAEQRRRQEAEALRQASLALGSTLDRDQVLEQLLEQIDAVLSFDCANVMWVEAGVARVIHQRGYELAGTAEATAALRLAVDDIPNLRRMAATHCPHIISDTRTDPDWVTLEPTSWIRSWAGAPIIARNEAVGFFSLDSETPGSYTAEHADLLAAFAAHASVAIENARLFTEVQAAYEKLSQTQTQLIQSAKLAAIGELAAGVAHELNNPLTSVLGFAELVMYDLDPDDPAKEDLVVIAKEARRARDIVRDLLEFSRQTESRRERADINQAVQKTLALVRRQFEANRIAVEGHYAPDLPFLRLDVGRIQQVFLNLFTNALYAMPQGGTLRVDIEQVDDRVAVRVADTGIGIPTEHLARIFDPFFTTKPMDKGTGLGLSVALGIVEDHGGRIEVESQEGAGSTFTVWLPAGTADEEMDNGR